MWPLLYDSTAGVPKNPSPELELPHTSWREQTAQYLGISQKTLSRRCSGPSPHQEGAWGLREQSKPWARGFIGFLRKPRNINLFLSIFFSVDSGPPGSSPLKDLNTEEVRSFTPTDTGRLGQYHLWLLHFKEEALRSLRKTIWYHKAN